MPIENITDDNYPALKEYERAVLVLSMSWCGPCQRYRPVLESVAERMPDTKFGIAELDKGHLIKLKTDYPKLEEELKNVPTTLLLYAGKEVGRFEGAHSNPDVVYHMIKEKIEETNTKSNQISIS